MLKQIRVIHKLLVKTPNNTSAGNKGKTTRTHQKPLQIFAIAFDESNVLSSYSDLTMRNTCILSPWLTSTKYTPFDKALPKVISVSKATPLLFSIT